MDAPPDACIIFGGVGRRRRGYIHIYMGLSSHKSFDFRSLSFIYFLFSSSTQRISWAYVSIRLICLSHCVCISLCGVVDWIE